MAQPAPEESEDKRKLKPRRSLRQRLSFSRKKNEVEEIAATAIKDGGDTSQDDEGEEGGGDEGKDSGTGGAAGGTACDRSGSDSGSSSSSSSPTRCTKHEEFNINGFTRILAEGEAFENWPKDKPRPNQLQVRVIQARNLIAADTNMLGGESGATSDPFVKVNMRSQQHRTATIATTLNPYWDETKTLVCRCSG
jgi:hypothetical protein